jgi:hypothetical protein
MKEKGSGFLSMAVGLFIILLAVAIWQYGHFSQMAYAPTIQNDQNNISGSAADWKTYQDKASGFSFQYPSDFSLRDDPDTGSVILDVPVKNYFKTKLMGVANVTIHPIGNNCPESEGERFDATTTIRSRAGDFRRVSWSGIGAGNLYEGVEYTLIKDNLCYALTLFMDSANDPGVYPDYDTPEKIAVTSAQEATDKGAFTNLIDKMVSTFTFNH